MHYTEVIGYTYEDSYALCLDCARVDEDLVDDDDDRASNHPIFVGDEQDFACDNCLEPIE